MKIVCFKIKKKYLPKTLVTNFVIFAMLCTALAFSYAGGTLQAFNSKSGVEAIYYGDRDSNCISLMINVYWGDEFLQPMLDVFENTNSKATFFVGGMWASKNEDMLKKILAGGHELANHGYYHKDQDKISAEENYAEISQTHQIVKSLAGVEMNLFAPPSGAFNDTTLNIAYSLGYKTIMWTRDTIDWRDKDQNIICERATKDAKGGDLVLMHPTQQTLQALPKIISVLQEKNLCVTTVSQTLGLANY